MTEEECFLGLIYRQELVNTRVSKIMLIDSDPFL